MSGAFFHGRYLSDSSAYQIEGISPKIVNLSQITASAPSDSVIQNSGQAFLQGLYPPAGSSASQVLRNGSTVEAPLDGYQLIPMSQIQSGSGSEDNTWLQSTSACNNSEVSSNDYFYSTSFQELPNVPFWSIWPPQHTVLRITLGPKTLTCKKSPEPFR